jgi:hypothetical protein
MSKTFSGSGAVPFGVGGAALLVGAVPGDVALLDAGGAVLGAKVGVAEAAAWRSLEARRQPAKITRPATASGKRGERRFKAAPFTTRAVRVLGTA